MEQTAGGCGGVDLGNRFLPSCVVVDVVDDHFGYPKTLVLKNHVSRLILDGHRHVVLNLGQVQMLDSFGIAVLLSLLRLCREQQGHLSLYGVNDAIYRLMEITRMDRVLDIRSTEQEAIAQVSPEHQG